MTGARSCLLDDQRSTRQSRVGPDRRFGRKHRTVEELVPDRQGEAEVDVLGSVQLVVNAVKVRADEDPFQRPEAQIGVRVREGEDGRVDDEKSRRQRTVGEQARCPGSAR